MQQNSRRPPVTRSPAAVVAVAAGVPAVLFALSASGFAVALFLAFVALAAVPLALSDRAGRESNRLALAGAAAAVLALFLVGRLLVGAEQQVLRQSAPASVATAGAPAA